MPGASKGFGGPDTPGAPDVPRIAYVRTLAVTVRPTPFRNGPPIAGPREPCGELDSEYNRGADSGAGRGPTAAPASDAKRNPSTPAALTGPARGYVPVRAVIMAEALFGTARVARGHRAAHRRGPPHGPDPPQSPVRPSRHSTPPRPHETRRHSPHLPPRHFATRYPVSPFQLAPSHNLLLPLPHARSQTDRPTIRTHPNPLQPSSPRKWERFHDIRIRDSKLSRWLPLGRRDRRVPSGGRGTGGRPRALHLGHLQPRPRQGPRRRHRGRRRGPLPPLARRRTPDGGTGSERLPLLRLLAARAAHRPGPRVPPRPRLLQRTRRRAARARHPADADPLPLGPAPGAGDGRRLAGTRDRPALRGLRAPRRAGARRPRRAVDDPQRALVQRLPGVRGRGARPRPDGPSRRAARRAPPQPGARARRRGAARRPPRARAALRRPQPQRRQGPFAIGRGPRRSAAGGRARDPYLHRAHAPRRVPRRPRRGHRGSDGLVVRTRWRSGRHQAPPRRAGRQLLHALSGISRH